MKKMSFLLVALLSIATVFAQKAPIEFKETKFTFGKIKQHVPVTHVFSFKNTSSKPVVIESAVAGCGCTTPEYPKNAIPAGKSGDIKVTYNAEAPNGFTKPVTVKVANAKDPIVLTIEGDVVPADAATATKDAKTAKKAGK